MRKYTRPSSEVEGEGRQRGSSTGEENGGSTGEFTGGTKWYDLYRARDLRQFDGAPHLPRRSMSTLHNKSRPCMVESDTRDETSGFGTNDCEPFATRHVETR